MVARVVALTAALAVAGCGGSSHGRTATTAEGVRGASCDERGQRVVEANASTGAARRTYLVSLHEFQRDCPAQAKALGLWHPELPRCAHADDDRCFAGTETTKP